MIHLKVSFFLLKQGFAKYMDPFGNECVSIKFKETMEDDALPTSVWFDHVPSATKLGMRYVIRNRQMANV